MFCPLPLSGLILACCIAGTPLPAHAPGPAQIDAFLSGSLTPQR